MKEKRKKKTEKGLRISDRVKKVAPLTEKVSVYLTKKNIDFLVSEANRSGLNISRTVNMLFDTARA